MFSIIGTGSSLPECVKTNADLSAYVNTTDEWITTRTGIRERHICTYETLSDLAAQAGRNALEMAGVLPEELDMIICATIRGDTITPSLACLVEEKIGASCPAFDLNAACSGFIYAMDVAAGFFARKRVKKVLIIAAEAMSKMADWNDRSTCVLFGDGAGAVVLTEGESLLSIRLSATGNRDILYIPNVEGNCPFSEQAAKPSFLTMNGQEVYKFAVNALCSDLTTVIAEAGLTKEDIDWVLPHQANIRIIETAQGRLDIPKEKIRINIDRTGNTSASSILLLLDEMNRAGELKRGMLLAMSAFGGGLTTAACVLRW